MPITRSDSLTANDACLDPPLAEDSPSLDFLCEGIDTLASRPRRGRLRKRATPPSPDPHIPLNNTLVVEGLIGRDKNGVVYAPQSSIYVYDSSNVEHSKQVEDCLKIAEAKWNNTPCCSCSRFKQSSPTTVLPTVVGGLTRGYITKGIPCEKGFIPDVVDEPERKKRRK